MYSKNKYVSFIHSDFKSEYLDPNGSKAKDLKKYYESQGYQVTVEKGSNGFYLRIKK